MPRCPKCKTQAAQIKYENVPIYHCGDCGGHWLTNPQRLELILERREVVMPEPVKQKMMDIADASDSKGVLWCMPCAKEMIKEQFKHWPEIQIDRCPKCGGIWLDQGELEKCQIYWEYAQDHPEEWEGQSLIERKALLNAEWQKRKSELRDRADRTSMFSRHMSYGSGSIAMMLFRIFQR